MHSQDKCCQLRPDWYKSHVRQRLRSYFITDISCPFESNLPKSCNLHSQVVVMPCSSSIEWRMQRWSMWDPRHHQHNVFLWGDSIIVYFDPSWRFSGERVAAGIFPHQYFCSTAYIDWFLDLRQSELLMLPHLITSAAAAFSFWFGGDRWAGAMVMCYRCGEQKAILQNLVWLVVWKELGWKDDGRCLAWE